MKLRPFQNNNNNNQNRSTFRKNIGEQTLKNIDTDELYNPPSLESRLKTEMA